MTDQSPSPPPAPPPPTRNGLVSTVVLGFIEALRKSPGLLVVSIVNFLVIWLLFSAMQSTIKKRDEIFRFVLERCSPLTAPPRGDTTP